jgi:hypothetical protein
MDAIESRTINLGEYAYKLELYTDYDAGYPWDNMELLGEVSEWTSAKKAPGQKTLNYDNPAYRYYDFQAAMVKAKKEFANSEDAVKAVEFEFGYLKDWCDDKWQYVGAMVTNLANQKSSSLWGIDSTDDTYLKEVFNELVHDLLGDDYNTIPHMPYGVWDAAK